MAFRVKTENETIYRGILTLSSITVLNFKMTQLLTFNISGSVNAKKIVPVYVTRLRRIFIPKYL